MTTAETPRLGMGATPHEGGTSFRVWAPHADSVHVTGTFDDWAGENHLLTRSDQGYWSGTVKNAGIGDTYKYRIVNGEQVLWRVDPYVREVTNSVGEGVITDLDFDWGGDDYRTPPWHEMVIYELHVGTFNAVDGELGTFDSAVERLGYLSELGVNTILVMPFGEFAGDISWGYNPAHPFAIESAYGGPAALRRFIMACHEHDIAVLVDVVYNHFGPSDLGLWQFDGWSENAMGGIYFYNDWRANTPWGDSRPDYGRPEVRDYIRDHALMWLEDYHADGLRFDATSYIRNVRGGGNPGDDLPDGWGLLRWLNDEVNARQPWKPTIAEDLRNEWAITEDTSDGGAGFDSQWDAAFVHPIRAALITPEDTHRDMHAVAGAIAHRYHNDIFERVIYTESHDEVANGSARVPEEIWGGQADSLPSRKRSTLGAVITFTSPGIPMIFQGQEFLTPGWFQDTRPLDWSRVESQSGIHQLYRDLFGLRANRDGVTAGLKGQNLDIHHLNQDSKVLAYHRWDQGGAGDSCVILLNLSGVAHREYIIGFPIPGKWHVRLNTDWSGYGSDYDDVGGTEVVIAAEGDADGQRAVATVDIGGWSALLLSQ
ncbi:MAG: 1,4-alpha-glucan branching protein [Acidimicrobiia bacterium]|nr:1,4-alpha-glucan branching protein [Acidimicrobiia bacterium]